MATVVESRKACAVNPLRMSAPLGASLAFMGLDATMPVMHGSQGCTSFALVLMVRHFKEAIPLQTTAMNEVTTILGGTENLEQALLNIRKRAQPRLIAICSTGLTETKGDDVEGDLRLIRQRHPELADTAVLYVSTPDYVGGLEDGWALAARAVVEQLAGVDGPPQADQITVLPGCHLTPGDIDELRELIEAFGLRPVFVPDLSRSLDGHIPPDWRGTTLGGTTLDELRGCGRSALTLAIGEHMRPAAQALHARGGPPVEVLDRLTGLAPCDRLMQILCGVSGRPVPERLRRQRSRLLDAMLDAHFHTGGRRLALAAEPDLLLAVGATLAEVGAQLACVIAPQASPALERIPAERVLIGDLGDLEAGAAGCDLLLTHSHGRQAAERLGKPLLRIGFPLFDRIGNAHRVSVGYRGTRNLIVEVANLMIDALPHAGPGDWPLPPSTLDALGLPAGPAPAAQAAPTAGVPT